jgi:glyoxylase-like metal-dependent hydrolase (beta-lactamase superfamily II)
MEFRVVSIGCLPAHPLWGERAPARTGHATTTLVTSGERRILVDPGLPAPALLARLSERAHLGPGDITDVFLTSFHPECRRALAAFEDADWWIAHPEREAVGVALAQRLKAIRTGEGIEEGGGHDPALVDALTQDVALLQRCRTPDDALADRVALFPMPGVTPGLCGLLLETPRFTVLVCGDAIPTIEHLEQGRLPANPVNVDQARASFEEALEVADVLILGRDNLAFNPTKRPF